VLALSVSLIASSPGRAMPTAPDQPGTPIVETLQDALLDLMRNGPELGYSGRRDQIAPVIETSFDLGFIARKSAGRHWKQLTGVEQAQIVEALSRFSIATYAARFSSYDGERFELLSEAPGVHDTTLVATRIVSDERTVRLDYRLHQIDGRWLIIDVMLDGSVSELALRRSEYASILKREGLDGLLAALEKGIEERETQGS
jgi:phospholipid transport system substrate-binding protein